MGDALGTVSLGCRWRATGPGLPTQRDGEQLSLARVAAASYSGGGLALCPGATEGPRSTASHVSPISDFLGSSQREPGDEDSFSGLGVLGPAATPTPTPGPLPCRSPLSLATEGKQTQFRFFPEKGLDISECVLHFKIVCLRERGRAQ